MSAHTPGPWRSQGWVPTWAHIPVKDAHHNLVASLCPDASHGYTRDQVEANARLIAAAPDMLAELKAIISNDCGCAPVCQCNSEASLRIWKENIQDAARAAIAKAEGRS